MDVFKMTVSVEDGLAYFAEELRHEGGASLLSATGLGALPLADGDHEVAGLGDLHERLDEGLLIAGVAAMLEGVEVALGSAGAGPAAAPTPPLFLSRRWTQIFR